MLVPLIKITKSGRDYFLEKIFINPKQIIYVWEDNEFKQKLKEGAMSIDLHQSTGFSKIKINLNNQTEIITVVGDPSMIETKISSKQTKTLLKG